mmetsp:Transcript_46472/g.145409  ORF Transcript_46472/g.145409 Transcript_46472/m.145409 type:complete len:271 (+) Transcript_46472:4863-5675(+)
MEGGRSAPNRRTHALPKAPARVYGHVVVRKAHLIIDGFDGFVDVFSKVGGNAVVVVQIFDGAVVDKHGLAFAGLIVPHPDAVAWHTLGSDVETPGLAVGADADVTTGMAPLLVEGAHHHAHVVVDLVVEVRYAIHERRHEGLVHVLQGHHLHALAHRMYRLHEDAVATVVHGDVSVHRADDELAFSIVLAQRRDVAFRDAVENVAEESRHRIPDSHGAFRGRENVDLLPADGDARDEVVVREGLLLSPLLVEHVHALRGNSDARIVHRRG